MPSNHRRAVSDRQSTLKCGKGSLIGFNPKTEERYLLRLRCKSWVCPHCRISKGLKAIAQIVSGAPDRFLTLTCNPARHSSKQATIAELKPKFRLLAKAIRKRYGSFEYVLVWELTKRGWPHLHVAVRGPYIDQRWLSAYWCGLTGAKIVHITKVRSHQHAAKYMSKYLLKDMSRTALALGRGHVVQFSKHYRQEGSDEDARLVDRNVEWTFDRRDVEEIAREWRLRGFVRVPNDSNPDLPTFLYFENPFNIHPPNPLWRQINLNFRYGKEEVVSSGLTDTGVLTRAIAS